MGENNPVADDLETDSGPLVPDDQCERIGPYKLIQKIGEGGFGTVWIAEQERPIRRRVALKITKLGMDTREVIARFEQERQALAMMDHPHIARVFDAGATQSGRPFFAMELVHGIKITDYCDQANLSTAGRLELFMQVCNAVQHAHQKGIIHRDLKPSNILVALRDGVPVPKVIDFGVAKATAGTLTEPTVETEFNQFIGTPAYMSPEQAQMSNLDVDTRSDIYSLGVLLYELLVGHTPFDREILMRAGLDEMRRVIREQEPPRPSTALLSMTADVRATVAQHRQADGANIARLVTGDLDWIVMKALEKDRTHRYDTAVGFAEDIRRYLENEPVTAAAPSVIYRLRKFARRNKTGLFVAALITVVLLAATGISIWEANLALAAKNEANEKATAERTAREESEAITNFLTGVFRSADPARDGRTITVAETLGAAVKSLDHDLAGQPARRAQLQATVGSAYRALGLPREAIPLQEKALDYYRDASGMDAPATVGVMTSLAFSYSDDGRREEALKLREEVLPLTRKVKGPTHPATLLAMNNLALSYFDGGHRAEALQLREQVLELSRKINGPEHLATIGAMTNLAISYTEAGRPADALKLQEQVLPLSRKVNGPGHPDTLKAMNYLARSYFDAGRVDEALKLLEAAVEQSRKVNGAEHHETLWAMNDLANLKAGGGASRRDEALKLREQVLELTRKARGPEHPATLTAMNNLALSYGEAGRQKEALKLREEVLPLSRTVNGAEHPDTLKAMNNLALSYFDNRQLDEALKLREELLSLSRKVNGPEHPVTIGAMTNLAISYTEAGRLDEALKLREEVLPISRKVNGSEHPDTINAMNLLARSYFDGGRHDEALKLLEAVVELSRKVNGPEHLDTLWAVNNLANCYADADRREEALTLREQVLEIGRKTCGPKHPLTFMAMGNLALSYGAAGRAEEALRLLEELSARRPEDPTLALQVAVLEVWFGRDANYLATCQRMLELAERTPVNAAAAEHAARACCLRSSSDPALLNRVLRLAQHAAELATNPEQRAWCQMTLGMAEFRSGNDPKAEQALILAEESSGGGGQVPPFIVGPVRLFRAMILFRAGKEQEARTLFVQAEAGMKPLPGDDSQVLQNEASHDDVIFWLVDKEAKALLQ